MEVYQHGAYLIELSPMLSELVVYILKPCLGINHELHQHIFSGKFLLLLLTLKTLDLEVVAVFVVATLIR